MDLHHEEVLAAIARSVGTDGATLDEVDAAIAAKLDVPVECYMAYQLVWAAIEVYRHRLGLVEPTQRRAVQS